MIGPRDGNGKLKKELEKVPEKILLAEEATKRAYSAYQDACGKLHQVILEVKKETGYSHPFNNKKSGG